MYIFKLKFTNRRLLKKIISMHLTLFKKLKSWLLLHSVHSSSYKVPVWHPAIVSFQDVLPLHCNFLKIRSSDLGQLSVSTELYEHCSTTFPCLYYLVSTHHPFPKGESIFHCISQPFFLIVPFPRKCI